MQELRWSAPQMSAGSGLSLTLGNADGSPMTPSQLARIQIHTATNATHPYDLWDTISNPLVLTNGVIQVSGLDATNAPARFFRATQGP